MRAIVCVPERREPRQGRVDARASARRSSSTADDFDDAREHCEALAAEHGYRYIHSGNEPHLIAGVGTHTLETLERQPDLDVLIVPIGGGSGAAGACIVAAELSPRYQRDRRPVRSGAGRLPLLARGRDRRGRMDTAAEGLATRVGFELPQRILRERLTDFVLVSEDEIATATAAHARADAEPDRGRPAQRRSPPRSKLRPAPGRRSA